MRDRPDICASGDVLLSETKVDRGSLVGGGGELTVADILEHDLEAYRAALPTLAGSEGKFALIVSGELKGVFESYGDALNAGYQGAGLKPFLVKQIAATEFVAYFTRDVDGECRT